MALCKPSVRCRPTGRFTWPLMGLEPHRALCFYTTDRCLREAAPWFLIQLFSKICVAVFFRTMSGKSPPRGLFWQVMDMVRLINGTAQPAQRLARFSFSAPPCSGHLSSRSYDEFDCKATSEVAFSSASHCLMRCSFMSLSAASGALFLKAS